MQMIKLTSYYGFVFLWKVFNQLKDLGTFLFPNEVSSRSRWARILV